MKKIIAFILISLSFFVSAPTIAADQNFRDVRVGVYDNYPKIYRDEAGNIKGFWADITNYIAKKENWNVVYVHDTWDNNLNKLEKGEIDFMVDVAVSEEREERFTFNNETALISWGVFYTQEGEKIESFQNLEGKKIAILTSGIHYSGPAGLKEILSSFGLSAQIINVENYEDVFKLLDNKQADVGIVSWYFGVANEQRYKVQRTSLLFNPVELKFAFQKDGAKDSYLLTTIDKNLKEIKANNASIYYEAIQNNFGHFLGKVEVWPEWLIYVLMAIALFLIALIINVLLIRNYNKKLEHEVEAKVLEIKEDEEKYTAVVNEAQDAVIIIQEQTVKFANKAAIEMGGYKSKEIVGHPFMDFVAPEEKQSVYKNYEQRLGGKTLPAYESKLIKKDGSVLDVEISGNVIHYGNKLALVSVIRDVSERKKIENRLKAVDALKSKFIEVVSHQLRTPLNAARWNLEYILSGQVGKQEPASAEIIHSVLDANTEVINRVGDLLIALEIEENKNIYLRKTPTDIQALWQSVLLSNEGKAGIKNLVLTYNESPAPLPSLEIDIDKIRLCFERILDNAITYTKEKGFIDISLEQVRDSILFKVKDSGIGIPKNEQEDIGKRFFRASNASSMKTDASGLGLFIAKHFIERHGGQFGFESTEGKGSTFWFTLPVKILSDNK